MITTNMTNYTHSDSGGVHHHPDLRAIAINAMRARGFLVRFPDEVSHQLKSEKEPTFGTLKLQDLSSLLWSSIDNDDSKDLDQIECARTEKGGIRLYVGIADVDWFVPLRSPIDQAAAQNTTSVYTGVTTFPMLPDQLSTDLSSLNEGGKRLAMVTELLVADDGRVTESAIYPAIVQNKAQLTYNAVADWLEGTAPNSQTEAGSRTLTKIQASEDLQAQLRLQDKAAGILRERRHEAGALTFYSSELKPVMSPEGTVIELQAQHRNRASLLIEDLMVAANQATAMFLDAKGLPSVRRVVRTPARWDRIVGLAASMGSRLPADPDAASLEGFLQQQHKANPDHFADLSLAVIKLLGRGEYVLKAPGDTAPGHFGLAVNDYSHSTAPNRRYPDLLTQRLLKAAISGAACPYSNEELSSLATHCTEKEDDANRVERFVKKCAAATMLQSRIGEVFEAVISGVSSEGTWVRLSHPPVEGKLFGLVEHLDVGHRVRVQLASVNPEKGFIDFELK
jgi:VacB/RNase II family 3'-5' exoribonuclease